MVFSQEHHHEESKEPGWETIVSGVSFFHLDEESHDEEGVNVGTELHLTYWFTHTWALGVGYTHVFTHEKGAGDELALIASYKPAPWITVNSGPNLTLASESGKFSPQLSAYLEAEINIFIGDSFHLGPVAGGLIGKKLEAFAGIHLGYEF